jgi:hypothetical protein
MGDKTLGKDQASPLTRAIRANRIRRRQQEEQRLERNKRILRSAGKDGSRAG